MGRVRERPLRQSAEPTVWTRRRYVGGGALPFTHFLNVSLPSFQKQPDPQPHQTQAQTGGSRLSGFHCWLRENYPRVLAEIRDNPRIEPLTEAHRLYNAIKDKSPWEARVDGENE